MPAPERTYRLADCGIYLRQVMRLSHTSQAVYLYLREGPRSQRSYVVEINAPELAGRLKTTVPAARRAIAELVSAGLLELDEDGELGWLCADAARFPPANPSVTTSILGDLSAYSASVLITKVREFIMHRPDTVPNTLPDTQGVRESGIQGVRKQGTKNTTPVPAAPAPLGLLLDVPKVDKPKDNGAQKLLDAYNELCPSLPRCTGKSGSAARQLAEAAWKRDPVAALWHERFTAAEASDFLSGRSGTFKADFLWIVNKTNAEKIDAGRYANRGGKQARGAAPVLTQTERDAMATQDFTDFDEAIGFDKGKHGL